MSTIAVTGASGQLGRLVVAELKALLPSSTIIALARSPEKAADLEVSVRAADHDRPETLEPALASVDVVLLISGNAPVVRVAQHRNVIEAAQRAGVKRVVYTSGLHADTVPPALGGEHRATEEMLQASGLAYTVLRNGMYTENYMRSLPATLAAGALLGSAGGGRIASAARADYAAAAAVVLAEPGHEGRIYELAGDEAWTFSDLAAEFSRQTGRTIPYKDLPAEEYVKLLVGAGIPQQVAAFTAGGQVAAAQGLLFDDSRQLSRLLGRPTTPLSDTIAHALTLVAR